MPKIYRCSLQWFSIACGVTISLLLISSILSDYILEQNEQRNMLVQQSNFTPKDSQIILNTIRNYQTFSSDINQTTITDKGCGQDNSRVYSLTWRGYQINEFNRIFNTVITQGLIKIVAFKISRPHKLNHDYIYSVALGETKPIFTGTIKFKVYNHNTVITNASFCR